MGKGGQESKRIYRTSQKIRIINVFPESLLSESFPSLGVTVHLTSPGCPPALCWSLDLPGGAAQILTWSCSCVLLPPVATAIRASAFSFVGALSGLLYIPQTQSLLSWSCGFNLQPVQLVGRFWVFFLSRTAAGFQLWFYFHLYMGIIHWGLAPEAALEGLGLLLWGPGVEVVQLLGSQGFWQHQVLRGLVARVAGNTVL